MSTERCIGIVFCISYLLGFVVVSKNLHFISSCSAQLFLKKTAPCTQKRCKNPLRGLFRLALAFGSLYFVKIHFSL